MSKYSIDIWNGEFGTSRLLNMPNFHKRANGWPDMRYSEAEKIMQFFAFADQTQRASYLKSGVVPAYFNYSDWNNE